MLLFPPGAPTANKLVAKSILCPYSRVFAASGDIVNCCVNSLVCPLANVLTVPVVAASGVPVAAISPSALIFTLVPNPSFAVYSV